MSVEVTTSSGISVTVTTPSSSSVTVTNKGPKGDIGETGPAGSDGVAGATGATGATGAAAEVNASSVTAAGALMDSEVTNLADVKSFDASDYATSAQGTLAANALPKTGGAMTGAITTNSTFDGVDVATRDGVLTSTTATANAALPKAGGEMSGNITFAGSQTVDGKDVSTLSTAAEAHAYVEANALALTAALTTNSTIDGVDIATRDGVLTSTTATANAALPKTGGAMTGAITTNSTFDGVDVAAAGTLATNAMPKSGGAFTGAVTTNSTIDGRDVAADGVLATNALPKGGGTMSGAIAMGNQNITGGGTITGTVLTGTSLVVDNITVDANTISATDTNGNVLLASNGTGFVELKGDTNAGAIRFNCEDNSHGVTIKGPAHSAGATYTLTLPTSNGDDGQVLKTDGDGVLAWVGQADTQLTTEEVQDISGALVASGGTKTNIAVTYDDANGNMDFVVASDLSTSGNAGTATALATARAINGVDFDGTSAVTVPAAGSTLTDTVPVSKGGTNATSFTDKAVIITQDSGTDTLAAVAMTTNGSLLIGGSSGPAVSTLTAGTNITITNADGGITIAAAGGGGSGDGDIEGVTAGTGLSGGGDSGAVTLNVEAAQAGITSVVNSSLEIGRDADNRIKFGTDNQIIFEVSGGDNVIMKASGEIEATKFDGALEGNADTATLATTVTVTDNESTDEENVITFVAGAAGSGSVGLEADGNLTYNPSTGTVSATELSVTKRKFAIPADGAGNVSGDVIYIGSGSTTAGKIHYFTHSADATNGSWIATNSNDPTTAKGLIAVALGDDPDVDGMLLRGTADLADNIVGTEVMGSIIYLDKATAGAASTAPPSADGDIVRVIGYALTIGDVNKIWFNPDNTWLEI